MNAPGASRNRTLTVVLLFVAFLAAVLLAPRQIGDNAAVSPAGRTLAHW
jgi:hypothetical protein